MGVVVVCCALVLLGLVAIVRWGGLELRVPSAHEDELDVVRRYVWYVAVTMTAGLLSGLLIAGPGGRLVMRLLAATAGDAAQGRITEAEETVGRITTGGTIGLVVFGGLFFGLASGVVYMVIRRWLPSGRLGGLAFGALLLVVVAPALDPLRRENPDFDLVGPGWLAVVAFVALGLAHGMLVAAVAGRYGSTLPLIRKDRRLLLRYSPLVLLAPAITPAVAVLVVGMAVVGVHRVGDVGALLRNRRVMLAGRAALVVVAAATAPNFIGAVVDIAGRGP